MALNIPALIQQALTLADNETKSAQVTVMHHPWVGQSVSGTPSYAAPGSYKAILEYRQEMRKTDEGTEQVARAHLTFLQPVTPNGTAGRNEPIDERDLITLPDLSTGPILETRGLADPTTSRPYYNEVALGRVMKV
jgi:hypothetical protein